MTPESARKLLPQTVVKIRPSEAIGTLIKFAIDATGHGGWIINWEDGLTQFRLLDEMKDIEATW